jgi:hypothetical protein
MIHIRSIDEAVQAVRSCQDAGSLASLAGPFKSYVTRELQHAAIANGHYNILRRTGWLSNELARWDLPPDRLAIMRKFARGIDRARSLTPQTPIDGGFWRAVSEELFPVRRG